jgi:hypothetical protein
MEILTPQDEKQLFEIDENRLNELMQLCKQYYPYVPDYFIHSICNEQCMVEQGYEIDEEKGLELYNIAQEELKKTEYNIKIERSEFLN